MLESRAERSALGAARHSINSTSRLWLEFPMSKNLTELLKNPTSKQMGRVPSPRPFRTRSLLRFAQTRFAFAT